MEQITLRIAIEVVPNGQVGADVAPEQRKQVVGLMAETIVAVHRAQRANGTDPVDAGDEVDHDG